MQEMLQLGEEHPDANQTEITENLISVIKKISRKRHPDGKYLRFNQSKTLGCFEAEFEISDQLRPELQQGLFATPGHYPATLRFANATKFDDRKKDFHGLSIKLSEVAGTQLGGEPGIQDFTLNSHPVLFAATANEFLSFTSAMAKGRLGLLAFLINPAHWKAAMVMLKGRQKINNPFAIRYWSTTPYRHGLDQSVAVKYSVKPEIDPEQFASMANHENGLTDAMNRHLKIQPVKFDFMIQRQSDPKTMPIEDAQVLWDENQSPFEKVATITIQKQSSPEDDNAAKCENMAFNPWNCLAEHQPLGGINRARKVIYTEMARFRTGPEN